MAHFETVVCGLGVMGSAALYALARRGRRVLGIDRLPPGHDRGSSHGDTRVIRLSYFEHPGYVPLLRCAYAQWRALESAARRPLLHVTGIVEIGPADGALIAGTLASARQHDIPHEIDTARGVMRRYPVFRLPDRFVGVIQPDGGFVEAEAAVRVLQALARAAGAQIRIGETVSAVEPRNSGVRVVTDASTTDADTAIVAAGPWCGTLLPGLPLRVTRQVMAWFAPAEPDSIKAEKLPVFLLESAHGIHYGFPPFGSPGIKVAKHHHRDETADPDTYDRTVTSTDEDLIRCALAEHLPAVNGSMIAAKTCLYTATPDGDFIIDRLPGSPAVVVASPCSGHGFKFAPVIGEVLADLATNGTTGHDISRFRIARFY